jgi:hypothetical protein
MRFAFIAMLIASCTPLAAQSGIGGGSAPYTGGPIPQPPSYATTYNNLHNATGHPGTWGLTTGTAACTPSCPSPYGGTNAFTFGVAAPSLSGSSTKMSQTTTGATYYYNTLGYNQWGCYAPSTGTTTTGTLTINVTGTSITYVPGASTDTITISASASDTTYTVTGILIYVDGSSTASFNSSTTPPITPISPTLTGFSDTTSHVFAVKAFNSNGGSSIYSFTTSFGPTCGAQHSMVASLDFYPPSANTGNLYAYEYDPKILVGGYTYEGALQCRLVGAAPVNAWYVWNPAGTAWVLPAGNTYACNPLLDAWNSAAIYLTIDTTAHTETYVSATANGAKIFTGLNFTVNAASGTGFSGFGAQYQFDGIPNPTASQTIYEYVDLFRFSVF